MGAAAPLQEAAVTGLEFPDSYYQELKASYTRRRDIFLSGLAATGLRWTEPEGAYFVLLDVSPLGFATDTQAAGWLTREVGVAGVPGSSFFREPEHRYVRFHFAKNETTLTAATQRLSQIKKLRGL